MNTVIINSVTEFNEYFNFFKESARYKSSNDVFLIGLDTEFISKNNYPEAFSRSHLWNQYESELGISICVLQLASDTMCLVINLVKMGLPLPNNIIDILVKDSWIKVGVGIDQDLKHLSNNFHLGHCGGSIDIRNLGLLAKCKNPSLEILFNQLVGRHIKKTAATPSSICDWSGELNESQLLYAARDALMSLLIFKEIMRPSIEFLIQKQEEDNIDKILEINFINISKDNKDNKSNNPDDSLENTFVNYVGKLNEMAQIKKLDLPKYQEIEIINPLNKKKSFKVICSFDNKMIDGFGNSKKEAKQEAAKLMFSIIFD